MKHILFDLPMFVSFLLSNTFSYSCEISVFKEHIIWLQTLIVLQKQIWSFVISWITSWGTLVQAIYLICRLTRPTQNHFIPGAVNFRLRSRRLALRSTESIYSTLWRQIIKSALILRGFGFWKLKINKHPSVGPFHKSWCLNSSAVLF